LRFIELGLLHEDADRVTGSERRLAVRWLVEARHDLEDRRLSGTVGSDHADLGARKERHRDGVENDLLADRLAGTDHRIDVLSHIPSSLCRPRGVSASRWFAATGEAVRVDELRAM